MKSAITHYGESEALPRFQGMNAMERKLVGWSTDYSLGMPELDAQHKMLFDLINQLWQGIVTNADRQTQLKVIEQLEHYTLTHFSAEEDFLLAIEFPGTESHRQAHLAFTQRVADEKQAILTGAQVSLGLLHFLNDWLVNHIRGEDLAYAEYSAKRQERSMLGRFFKLFS